ncbi:MAG: AAA family ATPase, partial [Betaproteobacteria bacterium]|nr:AAA family ATPase [Betaproteobacteria bacterium]
MQYSDIVALAMAQFVSEDMSTPICLLGSPGIGKTSLARSIADQMTKAVRRERPDAPSAICQVVDLTSKMPEDMSGLPRIDQTPSGLVTRYAPQEWLAKLSDPEVYGVLCLDDLPAASPAVQV